MLLFFSTVSTASDGSTTGTKRTDGTGHGGGGGGEKAGGPHQQTLGDFVKTDSETKLPDNQEGKNEEEEELIDVGDDDEDDDEDDGEEEEEEDVAEVEQVKGTEIRKEDAEVMEISVPESEDNMSFHTPPTVRYTPGPYAGTPGSNRRVRQMAPMWSILPTVEVEFEDLATGAEIDQYMSVLEISSDWDEAERNLQTGRWGEALVYNYLRQQGERSEGVKVTWVNEYEETGQPFDILVECDNTKTYIEVKATKYNQKELFEISSKEVLFAEQQKEHFHLYRVYNAGNSENARLCRLQNLAYKMEKKEVRLGMYI